ncbi:helix-turn-helix transcriptional regulator [Gilvimarinus agarilyticus]|uniref:helix-turn-helix transcriptional regulator n=1 Tax=unclassified Gilvimarinus TaxID=2642066 RepID=UPI001C0A17E5|nr:MULTISPECIES: LuxR C-terminal-related transcriptional regulator [unclassified Gilvimarinus]MBU2885194.1 helix-turn-helix transcriptional regulator [Gilvimarinus agarilyticus]MDO6570091.1 LuxR C-terminal-related transcriptional regulator [Gilvimarinus sp. 2_MG-2023]MDO6748263.1 LuxR C-terminal-related transcriptional regulator [Gilvimarinus sp. 1_MG-2023]
MKSDPPTAPNSLQITPQICQIWDQLAQFDAARSDEALDYLLESLCQLVEGTSASWIGALRLNAHEPNDPLLGWRPRITHLMDSKPSTNAFIKNKMQEIDKTGPDPSLQTQVRMAGKFRVYLQDDIVDKTWYQGDYYLTQKEHNGLVDRLYVVTPLNEDMECYITVDRVGTQPPFCRSDCQQAAALLRGLSWFQRQVALSYGLHIGAVAITPTERRVLQQLLTDSSEREIADELGLAYTTVHSYVTSIYRKFDVNGRAGLTALWLGKGLTVC